MCSNQPVGVGVESEFWTMLIFFMASLHKSWWFVVNKRGKCVGYIKNKVLLILKVQKEFKVVRLSARNIQIAQIGKNHKTVASFYTGI